MSQCCTQNCRQYILGRLLASLDAVPAQASYKESCPAEHSVYGRSNAVHRLLESNAADFGGDNTRVRAPRQDELWQLDARASAGVQTHDVFSRVTLGSWPETEWPGQATSASVGHLPTRRQSMTSLRSTRTPLRRHSAQMTRRPRSSETGRRSAVTSTMIPGLSRADGPSWSRAIHPICERPMPDENVLRERRRPYPCPKSTARIFGHGHRTNACTDGPRRRITPRESPGRTSVVAPPWFGQHQAATGP